MKLKGKDLQLDEELFDAILDISSEAIWVHDVKLASIYWLASKGNREKYGLPEKSVQEDFWKSNIHAEDRAKIIDGYNQALNDPSVKDYKRQYRFLGKQSVEYFIEDNIKFIRDKKGNAIRVTGVWRDVTENHSKELQLSNAMERLKSERLRFKQITEVTNTAMWEINFETGKVTWFAGKRALEEFNLEKRGKLDDWKNAIYIEDRERVVKNFQRIVADNTSDYFDSYRVEKIDGSLAYVIDQGKITRDKNGKPIRAFGGWIDLTKEHEREMLLEKSLEDQRDLNRKLATREQELTSTEEELRQMNEQLKVNLDQLEEREFILRQSNRLAKIGTWEYEAHSKKMKWSEEMYAIYGVDNSFDVSDLNEVLRLFDEPSSRLVEQTFQNIVLHHELPFDITARIKTPLGYKKWIRMTAHPIVENGMLERILGITFDITYFKESEERLKTSEEKFAKAFRSNPDLMAILRESDLLIVDVNDRALPVLGYNREEVIGKPAPEFNFFVNPSDRENFYESYYRNGHVQMETPWRRKDGKIIYVIITSTRLELEGQLYNLSVIKDISRRRLAEERFVKAFDLSPDLMLIFREEDRLLVDVNSQLEPMSGYNRDEVLGKTTYEFKLWADPNERNNFLAIYISQGLASVEAALLRKDGTEFFGTVSAQRIQLAGEDHMLVVVRDVTGRKSAEEKIRQSEANLHATINNTALMVWSVDRSFQLITYNRPFADFIKRRFNKDVSPGSLILPKHPELKDEKDVQERWTERYMRALSGESFKVSDENNGTYYEFSLSPIIEGLFIIGVSIFGEDVTERKLNDLRLAEATQKIGELKLTALRSVMNPHFIFNALNSIQFFIAQNDRKNAIGYLSTFSKLIRGVLNNSVNNKIRLAEELELLQHYVDLELVRFDNKFDFVLDVEENLDIDNIEIPSLLIQPYVENAILHGLYNKPEKGTLKISVKEDQDNRILFVIEDDGIGREAAMELKQKNFPSHKSMGISLTEDRLKLINAQENVSFETTDLYEDGKPSGTRMKIWVKV